MKSYLSLIPISAKVRKRQNRMTILCIVISVFLVTAVFSMADMAIRMETSNRIEKDGSWHLLLRNISASTAREISRRDDVAAFSPYGNLNSSIDRNFFVGGKQAAICGAEKDLAKMLPGFQDETYPSDDEVIVSRNIQDVMDVAIGDFVTLEMPNGRTKALKIVGFNQDTAVASEYDALALFTNLKTFDDIQSQNEEIGDLQYYLQFKKHTNLRKAITEIKEQYGLPDSSVGENAYILAMSLSSDNSYILGLYMVAAVLAVMVILAGVFMIAASLNSNVMQRTSFYGMLRCLGAARNQVMKLVRLEALNWCKTAVPLGIALGTAVTWGLCLLMHIWVGGEFRALPLWEISPVGILCGGISGVVTVWAASASPAKKASKVSPIAAVSGNTERIPSGKASSYPGSRGSVDISLGVSHAVSSKKSLILMTGSFALSIILFLCFSVLLGWIGIALNSLKPYTPDISLYCGAEEEGLSRNLPAELQSLPGVKRAFGRMHQFLPAAYEGKQGHIDLISYDETQFRWAKADLVKGDLPKDTDDDAFYVLSVFDKSNSLTVGDTIKLDGAELTVSGVLNDSPFDASDSPTIICTEETFQKLTQKQTYEVIDIQLVEKASDSDVAGLRSLVNAQGVDILFSDRREGNQLVNSTYWAFTLFGYAFLAVIALITILNIVNSISLSVSARIRQYGIMRAVGMDEGQIMRMITSEAAAYGVIGLIVGCAAGLPLYRYLYRLMITHYFGIEPPIPWACLIICFGITVVSVCIAAYTPVKRIRDMAITETINEL
ncbi:MAG: ABC transporter permease [Clostridiaceae bacterium]|nr:ABC transporter permease [Clostridiaceae bacterium]MDY4583136.1 FtsX-like permease family protein [Candidatus Faecousia sp.]